MPRVADQYEIPVGTEGIPDTTVSSTKYNSFVHDVESDLNWPRPVIAGGTGATTAAGARTNLQTEVAMQAVTNFDSHVWEAGSFVAPGSPTGFPTVAAYIGAFVGDISNAVVHAWSLGTNPATPYVRRRHSGTWGAWEVAGSEAFVNVSGDTMTGTLTVPIVVTTSGGATYQFGGNAPRGFYGDATNIAIRTATASGGAILLQNASGAVTYGSFTAAGLNASGLQSSGPVGVSHTSFVQAAPAGQNAYLVHAVTGARQWSAGCGADGHYRIIDDTAARVDLKFDLGGNADFIATVNAPTFYGKSTGYQFRLQHTAVRDWGIAAGSGGMLHIDDVSLGKGVAQFFSDGTVGAIRFPLIPTTAAGANAHLGGGVNQLYAVTSSIRYKTDVKPLEKGDADALLQLNPITYKSKASDDDPDRTWLGFIAEEVAKVEPRLVIWSYLPGDWIEEAGKDKPSTRKLRDGAVKVPDGLAYDRISVLAVFKLKEQEARIKVQEDTIAALLSRIEALEAKVA